MRTGLLASSAAMAVGAVAASSGLLSGVAGKLPYQGGAGGGTQAAGPVPTVPSGDIPSPLGESTTPAGRGATTPTAPGATTAPGSPSVSAPGGGTSASRPLASPGGSAPAGTATPAAPTPTRTTAAPTTPVVTLAPARTTPATAPASPDAVTAARAQILALVNDQRATAGCKPLTASSALDQLAQSFSDDMAARGFFDHTDPDGRTPWDRAKALGIANLGGENIARGQADAQAVMDAWMNSPGHRANILNCDYTTLGVGIHFAPGGPWWTQDFGF
ncbi:CAP domain-containing protein [Streptomyces sp. ITFR-21]|nr:CAP domain-containing protein [Streptomyces sp. ITFR-21]WNI18279.1 CAP domain-containing protein [Streptomyces sp. ITFR-21]